MPEQLITFCISLACIHHQRKSWKERERRDDICTCYPCLCLHRLPFTSPKATGRVGGGSTSVPHGEPLSKAATRSVSQMATWRLNGLLCQSKGWQRSEWPAWTRAAGSLKGLPSAAESHSYRCCDSRISQCPMTGVTSLFVALLHKVDIISLILMHQYWYFLKHLGSCYSCSTV